MLTEPAQAFAILRWLGLAYLAWPANCAFMTQLILLFAVFLSLAALIDSGWT